MEKLDSPLEQLHPLGKVLDSPEGFLTTAARGLSRGFTATSDLDEELNSLVETLDSLREEPTSQRMVLDSLEVLSRGFTATSDLDEELNSLLEELGSLCEEPTSPWKVLDSLEVSSRGFMATSDLDKELNSFVEKLN